MIDLKVRAEIEDFYARYCAVLDEGPLEAWPDLFTEQCSYRLIPRENYRAGKPLATLAFESRGMLKDRIYCVQQTLFHQPYSQRHLLSGMRFEATQDDRYLVEANYLVIRTKVDEMADVLSVGRYYDELVRDGTSLRLAVKHCVFDNELIPNSLIYPI